MPIEIKELHIRVSVDASQDGNPSPGQFAAGVNRDADEDHGKDAIVAECVEQVMQILQSKAER